MTREEMDFIGSMNMCDEISNEAYQKIMAHCEEQEPCEDAISREMVLSLKTIAPIAPVMDGEAVHCEEVVFVRDLKEIPSVTSQPITLEKAIDYLHEIGWMQEHDKEMAQANGKIEQEPKVGEWLEKEVNSDKVIEEWQSARCSVCDKYHTTPYMYYFSHYEYCPHCGSKMEVET